MTALQIQLRRNINNVAKRNEEVNFQICAPTMYICYNTLPEVRDSRIRKIFTCTWNPKNFACRIRNPGRRVQNPRLLDSLTWGETPAYPESRKLDLLGLTSICPCIMSTVNKLKVSSQSTKGPVIKYRGEGGWAMKNWGWVSIF